MAWKVLTPHHATGSWGAATSGTASSSGDNAMIAAASVGAGKVLQLLTVKVRNNSSTETTVKLLTTGDELLFEDKLPAGQGFVWSTPIELAENIGVKLSLSGANAHSWTACSRLRTL